MTRTSDSFPSVWTGGFFSPGATRGVGALWARLKKGLSGEPYVKPALLGAVAMAMAVGAAGGLLTQGGVEDVDVAQLPLLRAKDQPIKVRPQDPGGMDVPFREILIYDRLRGEQAREQTVERLLPPPEPPMAPPRKMAEPAFETAAGPKAAPKPAPAVAAKPAPKKKLARAVKPKPVAPKPASAAQSRSGYAVQLASVRSQDAAKKEWKRLSKRHKDILIGLDPTIVKADLGGKGVYFRLRVAGMGDRKQAQDFCDKLKARKVGCMAVRS